MLLLLCYKQQQYFVRCVSLSLSILITLTVLTMEYDAKLNEENERRFGVNNSVFSIHIHLDHTDWHEWLFKNRAHIIESDF